MTAYTQLKKSLADITAKCCAVFLQSPFEDLTAFRVRHILLVVSILTSNAPGQWSINCPNSYISRNDLRTKSPTDDGNIVANVAFDFSRELQGWL